MQRCVAFAAQQMFVHDFHLLAVKLFVRMGERALLVKTSEHLCEHSVLHKVNCRALSINDAKTLFVR